jgi:hypothetical protein
MRTLNDYFLTGYRLENAETDGSGTTRPACIPDAGKLVGIAACVQGVAVDVVTTFDIMHIKAGSESDSGSDCTLAVSAANTGAEFIMGDQVELGAGDGLYIRSNGECTNSNTHMLLTYIIRR